MAGGDFSNLYISSNLAPKRWQTVIGTNLSVEIQLQVLDLCRFTFTHHSSSIIIVDYAKNMFNARVTRHIRVVAAAADSRL